MTDSNHNLLYYLLKKNKLKKLLICVIDFANRATLVVLYVFESLKRMTRESHFLFISCYTMCWNNYLGMHFI